MISLLEVKDQVAIIKISFDKGQASIQEMMLYKVEKVIDARVETVNSSFVEKIYHSEEGRIRMAK